MELNHTWVIQTLQPLLITSLADAVVTSLEEDIAAFGRASLVLPGGRTPQPLYADLASRPIAWDQVDIVLSDERWVPETDDASNSRLLKSAFAETATRFVDLKTDHTTPDRAVPLVSERLDAMLRPLSMVVLGMGEDGHIASIFPHRMQLLRDGAQCFGTVSPDGLPRLSLSMEFLIRAKSAALLIGGESKKHALEQFICQNQHVPVVDFLRRMGHRVTIYWSR